MICCLLVLLHKLGPMTEYCSIKREVKQTDAVRHKASTTSFGTPSFYLVTDEFTVGFRNVVWNKICLFNLISRLTVTETNKKNNYYVMLLQQKYLQNVKVRI